MPRVMPAWGDSVPMIEGSPSTEGRRGLAARDSPCIAVIGRRPGVFREEKPHLLIPEGAQEKTLYWLNLQADH